MIQNPPLKERVMRIALIDGDVLRYEIGAKSESKEHGPVHFDTVVETINNSIRAIQRGAGADEWDPIIFLTGDENFRNDIAVSRPYKGNRKSEKPYHWHNISAYLRNQYTVTEEEGLEADDLMSIEQYSVLGDPDVETIICTRDKDLRMVPGWQYGWECGAQREYGPLYVDMMGTLALLDKTPAKLVGTGLKFFYSQLLTGDSVDNIPGLPGCGPVKAFEALSALDNEVALFSAVQELYHEKGCPDEYLLEQGRLLWMTKELGPDRKPVLWEFPAGCTGTGQ